MNTPKVLVIDSDPVLTDSLVEALRKNGGCQVETSPETERVRELLDSNYFNVVITDFNTMDAAGRHLLDYVVANCPATPCVVFAKRASIRDSVEAIKRGAFDYLATPLIPEQVAAVVAQAAAKGQPARFGRRKEDFAAGSHFCDLVGESPCMRQVFQAVEKVAQADSTVLITGESGTGKELIARAIHCRSDRCDGPLVVINCGAIPGELLESELFGHEKGAFTGAHRSRMGRFEMANGGTIFLDEIGDMSPNLQVKLLRVLQEQNFERVGSTRTIKVDIRVLAATNKDLGHSIQAGTFREDLFYRLNVIPITVPPLRERKADIPLLVNFFLNRLGGRRRQDRKRMKVLSDAAMEKLMQYPWPGNVRELENLVERLSVLVENPVIGVADLPERIRGQVPAAPAAAVPDVAGGIDFNAAVENFQRSLILQALQQTGGIKAKAAELLQMNRTTLVEKIKKMKLEAESG
jgi:DNA-binding NtrC family response regulator